MHVPALDERSLVIFDFDGTIADTKEAIMATATTVLLRWGLPPKEVAARVGELIGPPFPQAFELVFGLAPEDAVEVTRQYREIYTKLGAEAWPAFDGMGELLGDLKACGRTLAVASSKRTPLVRTGLADNGLLELFDIVRAREADEQTTKADAVTDVLRFADATAADAVMVGDRHFDVEAAAACDVPCIGVLYGDTADRSELAEAGAAAIAETVDELRQLLLG